MADVPSLSSVRQSVTPQGVRRTLGMELELAVEADSVKLTGGFWAGRRGCSGRHGTSADGFGPCLVAGSLYSIPAPFCRGHADVSWHGLA